MKGDIKIATYIHSCYLLVRLSVLKMIIGSVSLAYDNQIYFSIILSSKSWITMTRNAKKLIHAFV